MFTGIIKDLGKVSRFERTAGGGSRLSLSSNLSGQASVGDSIAVNGVCLTVVDINNQEVSFDLSAETMAVTNLGELKKEDCVNLEPSLRPIDYLGGHFVSGHVEAIGTIEDKKKIGDDLIFKISAPKEIMSVTIPRGSICADGISLTVAKVWPLAFEVVIIPHTAAVTTLGFKGSGDGVNLESDLIARYIKRIIDNTATTGEREEFLRQLAKKGF